MKACGYTQCFERPLGELRHEQGCYTHSGLGGTARKSDRREAEHLLELLLDERFPRLCVPTADSVMVGGCCCIAIIWCAPGRKLVRAMLRQGSFDSRLCSSLKMNKSVDSGSAIENRPFYRFLRSGKGCELY